MEAHPLIGCTGWVLTDGHMGPQRRPPGSPRHLDLSSSTSAWRRAPRGVPCRLGACSTFGSILSDREHARLRRGRTSPSPPGDTRFPISKRCAALRKAPPSPSGHLHTASDVADLIWCPAHDQLHAANVINTDEPACDAPTRARCLDEEAYPGQLMRLDDR